MADINIAGVMRAGAYSPNHIGNDTAIFNAVAVINTAKTLTETVPDMSGDTDSELKKHLNDNSTTGFLNSFTEDPRNYGDCFQFTVLRDTVSKEKIIEWV